MTYCECHRETGSHESCCGYPDGHSPDCPTHGDGSGPRVTRKLIDGQARIHAQELAGIRKTLPEALDAAQTGEEFGQVLQGLFASLERARDKEEGR